MVTDGGVGGGGYHAVWDGVRRRDGVRDGVRDGAHEQEHNPFAIENGSRAEELKSAPQERRRAVATKGGEVY